MAIECDPSLTDLFIASPHWYLFLPPLRPVETHDPENRRVLYHGKWVEYLPDSIMDNLLKAQAGKVSERTKQEDLELFSEWFLDNNPIDPETLQYLEEKKDREDRGEPESTERQIIFSYVFFPESTPEPDSDKSAGPEV